MHAVAARVQHSQRSVEILAFEITIEGVGEKDNFAAYSAVMAGLVPAIHALLMMSERQKDVGARD